MDLAVWNTIMQAFDFKKRFLCSASFRKEKSPALEELNLRLLKISPEEFSGFISRFTDNPAKLRYFRATFESLVRLLKKETEVDNGELLPLIREEILLIKRLYRDLRHLLRPPRKVKVIGYGEITSSITLDDGKNVVQPDDTYESSLVCKTLPGFPDWEAVNAYTKAFDRYVEELTRLGIAMPPQKIVTMGKGEEGIRVYVVQGKLPSDCIGNILIRRMESDEAVEFFRKIVREMAKIFQVNLKGDEFKIALDGQISNWVYLKDSQPEIMYIDTSTPLFRINGEEQLDPEIFLKNTPWFLRGIIRKFFLQDVLDRYYDFRSVLIDLIANLNKEKRPDLIKPFIESVNSMSNSELKEFSMEEITEKEIRKYYREDAFIWKFFQAARKVDKFITEKIMRKKYTFRLPEKIER